MHKEDSHFEHASSVILMFYTYLGNEHAQRQLGKFEQPMNHELLP